MNTLQTIERNWIDHEKYLMKQWKDGTVKTYSGDWQGFDNAKLLESIPWAQDELAEQLASDFDTFWFSSFTRDTSEDDGSVDSF